MAYHDFSWIDLTFHASLAFVEPETPCDECSVKIGKIIEARLRGMSPSWSMDGFPQEDMIAWFRVSYRFRFRYKLDVPPQQQSHETELAQSLAVCAMLTRNVSTRTSMRHRISQSGPGFERRLNSLLYAPSVDQTVDLHHSCGLEARIGWPDDNYQRNVVYIAALISRWTQHSIWRVLFHTTYQHN